jgi:hypothetical protein
MKICYSDEYSFAFPHLNQSAKFCSLCWVISFLPTGFSIVFTVHLVLPFPQGEAEFDTAEIHLFIPCHDFEGSGERKRRGAPSLSAKIEFTSPFPVTKESFLSRWIPGTGLERKKMRFLIRCRFSFYSSSALLFNLARSHQTLLHLVFRRTSSCEDNGE